MNRRHTFGSLVIALVALGMIVGLTASGSAQNRSPDYDSLLDMLANAPDTPRVRASQIMADYVDYRALEIAADAARPGTLEDLDALSDEDFANWSMALTRVEFDPLSVADELPGESLARALPTATSAIRRMPEVLGVDWLEIDRAMAIGGPPARGVLLGGGPGLTDLRTIAPALADREFEVDPIGGVLVWHRFNDREIRAGAIESAGSLGNRTTDPFGVQQGHAARIAVLPGVLAGSRDWAMIDEIVGAARGTVRSLADDGEFRAAAAAITDRDHFDGILLRAIFTRREFTAAGVTRNKLGPVADDRQREIFAEVLQDRLVGELPPYRLAVMADRQDGDDEVAVVALVYDRPGLASAAADAVTSRVAGYVPMSRKVALGDAFDLTVASHVFVAEPGGRSVAVVTLRGAKPTDGRPGRLFRTLQTGFFFLESEFLIVSGK